MFWWRRQIISRRFATAKLASLAFFGSALSGCGAEAPESDSTVSTSADELFYRSTDIWQQKLLNVCWETAGWDSDKLLVKGTLKGQRSWEGAGNIVFNGFNMCTSSSEPGVHVTINSNSSSTSQRDGNVVRMSLDFVDPQTTHTACIVHGVGREECIALTALHEFGHALAIKHEQNRPDNPEAPNPPPCDFSGSIGDTTFGPWDGQSIMNYCNSPIDLSPLDRKGVMLMYGQRDHSKTRLTDVNNDGRADLTCYDVNTGYRWVDYASSTGTYDGTDWEHPGPSQKCNAPYNRIYKGQFAGVDSRTDLLCNDFVFGPLHIDLAAAGAPYTDWDLFNVSPLHWCTHPTGRMFVADFNGDSKDDLMCHDVSNGYMWIDYNDGNGGFAGTDWERATNWCWGKNGSLHIGRFNGDAEFDLLCHDRNSGGIWIDYADGDGRFMGNDFFATGKCSAPDDEVLIGDFNGDWRDDFLCHNMTGGALRIDYSNSSGQFAQTNYDWVGGAFCAHSSGRLFTGRINNDTKDDLLCHDTRWGQKWVAYANSSGQFTGTNWSTGLYWCGHTSGQLL